MSRFDCVIIGDILTDIIVKVNDNFDRFCHGGISYCSHAKAVLGGGGNIAVGLSTIGGETAFIGKAGKDFFGKLHIQDLKENGVSTRVFFDETFQTGLNIALVKDDEQRSFLVFRGANDTLSSDEIRKAFNFIKSSNYFYFSGFSLVKNPQRNAILEAINLAKRLKKKIVFDPGAYNLVKSKIRLFDRLLNLCDVFSPNLEEARAITNATNVNDVIEKLRERTPLTLLKCDKDGCILIGKEKVVSIPSYDVKCVDPTGAGDAFTAAAIFGLSSGLSLESIGQLANWFASQVVSDIGPRSFPEKQKIKQFIERLQ